jgi:osmotically-inducible protein OsmY
MFTYHQPTDRQLQQRVMDELAFDPSVKAGHVGVSARDGIVTLTGHVESYAEKYAAERAVRRIGGVKAVAQELEVRLSADKKTADDEIATRAVKLLEWDVAIPRGVVNVKVEHGIITLTGEVDWGYQRVEAEYDVRKLGGVLGVVNNIKVRPQAQPADVHAKIRAALERAADVDANAITVDVKSGKVILGGKVASWVERQAAERAAWAAPGVMTVEDNIVIARP